VQDFFKSINEAADLTRLSSKDKVRIARPAAKITGK
jgi:hypothetical protein